MLAASQRNFLRFPTVSSLPTLPVERPPSHFQSFLPSTLHARSSQRNSPQAISNLSRPSTLHSRFLSSGALPKLFPQSSVPFTLRSAALPKPFPVRPLQPSYSTVSCPSTLRSFWSSSEPIVAASCPSTLHARSLPAKLSSRKFQWFPIHPSCILAPSQQSPPQAISHGFLSLPKLFRTASCPSTLRSRSPPCEAS